MSRHVPTTPLKKWHFLRKSLFVLFQLRVKNLQNDLFSYFAKKITYVHSLKLDFWNFCSLFYFYKLLINLHYSDFFMSFAITFFAKGIYAFIGPKEFLTAKLSNEREETILNPNILTQFKFIAFNQKTSGFWSNVFFSLTFPVGF